MHDIENSVEKKIEISAEGYFRQHQHEIYYSTDRLFAGLMFFQWIFGIILALTVSPNTWMGMDHQTHIHVYLAVFLGGIIAIFPIMLGIFMPGRILTRYVISVAQLLYSALLIHLSGGRIETHFHVFGSFAFLAFYRDWKVLIPAMVVVAADHALRGIYWPQSVFGILTSSHWRWVEHTGWVLFENVFLIRACLRSTSEMQNIAEKQARLEIYNQSIEQEVKQRTKALVEANKSLKDEIIKKDKLEKQLIQSQKMEAIGILSAGIAHEINTPMQYINDNTSFLKNSFESINKALSEYSQLFSLIKRGNSIPGEISELNNNLNATNLDYLTKEIPTAIDQTLEGIQRVNKIVYSMKEFSHPGTKEKTLADLNKAIESTATVARNQWKYVTDLKTDFDPELPMIPCFVSEFNQVILNLIINAEHAIEDSLKARGDSKGSILISTHLEGKFVEIRVKDSGLGIPKEIHDKVFNPFFTTKDVGRGTGQGLALAHSVIVDKHGGTIHFETETNKGTTFIVRLPIA